MTLSSTSLTLAHRGGLVVFGSPSGSSRGGRCWDGRISLRYCPFLPKIARIPDGNVAIAVFDKNGQ